MTLLTGWRYVAFVGTIVGVCGAALYPITIAPMMDPTYYSEYDEEHFLCTKSTSNYITYPTMYAHAQRTCRRRRVPASGRRTFSREVSA